MKRIVVGTDGSAGAADALRWAAHLASRHGAEVVVMTGFVPRDSELPPRRVEVLRAELEAELEAWSEPARLGEVVVRTVIERGDPRPGILAVAGREDADLVVVGRVGSSAGPGLLRTGSMAEWLAHHVDRPLAVIGGAGDLTVHRVLIAVDGSEGSHAAVHWVRGMAADGDLRVIAASVDHPEAERRSDTSEGWREGLEGRIRDDYAAELVEAGFDVTALALSDLDVADAVVRSAADEQADLVVVGTRGLGGFTGLRVGGVALKTLHRADRPVLLVPPTD